MTAIRHNTADVLWEGPGKKVEVVAFSSHQAISELYLTQADLRTPDDGIKFDDLLFKEVKIKLKCGPALEDDRFFSGIVTRLSQNRTKHGNLPNVKEKIFSYRVEIRPKAWLLTKRINSRLFQSLSVKDFISEILDEHGVKHRWDLNANPKPLDYVMQYRETDYDFMLRRLADAGICFFFDQAAGEMILVDHKDKHPACKPTAEVPYVEDSGGMFGFGKHEIVRDFAYQESIGTGAFTVHDYNYETSQTNIANQDSEGKVPAFPQIECYDHNHHYPDKDAGGTLATLLKEAELTRVRQATGATGCRSLEAGHVFALKDHFRSDFNQKWLVTACDFTVEQGSFQCNFRAYPAKETYRPGLRPKPRVEGVLTGVVTGPDGAEVYLDDMGRCKVQFHWDREGEMNDRSSIWLRVSQSYAGKDYGVQWIPRVGNEVLVSFIGGDPDRPLVTGRVYNDFNTAPLGPDQKWKNIMKDPQDNHLIFDAEAGKENLNIRAQRNKNVTVINNMSTSVGNDKSVSVGNDLTTSVDNNESRTVGVDQSTTIGSKQSITVGSERSITVGTNQKQTIGAMQEVKVGAARTDSVGSNWSASVGGSMTQSVTGSASLTANGGITQSTPAAFSLTAGSSVSLTTPSFTVSGSASAAVTAPTINVTGAGTVNITCGASSISMNPAGITIAAPTVTITGTMVNLAGLIKHNC